MNKWKIGICGLALLGNLCMSACASQEQRPVARSVEETVDCVMESLKTVDLEQFNECTDNYVATHRNWIGVPVSEEYRVFNELQQPGIKIGRWKKKYEFNQKLTEEMMENLTWEVEAVEEWDDRAEITMEITNLNMGDVMGEYMIHIMENMIESTGTGLGQMIKDLSKIMDDEDGLLALVESHDEADVYTSRVTVTAYRENGRWKLHLDQDFINAFLGNINADDYSEDIERRMAELEEQYGEKMDDWAEEFTDKMERWAENFE